MCTRDTSLLTSLQNKLREGREQSRFAAVPGTNAAIPSPVRSTSSHGRRQLIVNRSTASSAYGLAGVDELFSKCTQYCLTSYANHAFSTRVRGGVYAHSF